MDGLPSAVARTHPQTVGWHTPAIGAGFALGLVVHWFLIELNTV